jgi:hypothetical protein
MVALTQFRWMHIITQYLSSVAAVELAGDDLKDLLHAVLAGSSWRQQSNERLGCWKVEVFVLQIVCVGICDDLRERCGSHTTLRRSPSRHSAHWEAIAIVQALVAWELRKFSMFFIMLEISQQIDSLNLVIWSTPVTEREQVTEPLVFSPLLMRL